MKWDRVKIPLVFGFFMLALLTKAQQKPHAIHSFKYTNPITREFSQSMRDHMILKVGQRWYMTGTSQPIWSGANPGVRLMVSDDLLSWKDAGWIINASKLSKDCPYNGRFWAPELHQIKGTFYLTVNSGHEGPKTGNARRDNHRIWIFSAREIDGSYTLVTPNGLAIGDDNVFTNDVTLFADDNGRTFVYCGGGDLWQAEIDLQTGKLINEKQGLNGFIKILGPKDPGNPDWMFAGVEGPFVIKRHGFYWMFFSSWTRGYEVGILKSISPLGPWKLTSDHPVFGTRKRTFREELAKKEGFDQVQYEDTNDPYVEVGHNAVFEGPDGKDWICCHYWLQGKTVIAIDHLPLYAETREQLGIEPLHFENGKWRVDGPTWTEQNVSWMENEFKKATEMNISKVSIARINYKGWENAIELCNNKVRLIVVPAIGRIMHYSLIDDKNILFENTELAGLQLKEGEMYIEDGKPVSPNIGGDRVYPSSENFFHLVTGSRNFADPWINNGPYSCTIVENGIRIESPVSQLQGVKMIRTIQLVVNSTQVNIAQELHKISLAKNAALDAVPLTIWNLTQIRSPRLMWMPLKKRSVFKDGFDIPVWPDGKNYAVENFELEDGLFILKPIFENHQKAGADAAGWVAGLVDNVLMVERFNPGQGAQYPDGGTNAAIYSNAVFAELECLSPEKILAPGQSIHHTISWELHRINHDNEIKEFMK